jgi:apolipoprotein N-acyltransferase
MSPLTFLIFIAWVPLLVVEENEPKRLRFFIHSYMSMLIWNIGTTWWIWNSTAAGAIGAIVANSFLMCIPLWGYHVFKTRYGRNIGLVSFIAFWLSFEFIHLNWQLSWPWLTLGNVFASSPEWVQWYEFTGTSGGSLWVLLVNVFLFLLIGRSARENKTTRARIIIATLAVLVLPSIISMFVNPSRKTSEKITSVTSGLPNIVVVQPNIDPYDEKFDVSSTGAQVQKLIRLSEQGLDSNTRLVIWPETAIPVAVWQDKIQENAHYQTVFAFTARHPLITLQSGIELLKNYGREKPTITAHEYEGIFFDAFNSSIAIKANNRFQFYNKSKLVPGVETLPDFLMWLGKVFAKFGGTSGGYGKDKDVSVFAADGNPYVSAPIICYESIYGDYVARYVQKGANVLTIMTNDGWWANTPGHRQHLNYARLRAIETRKWVARSANTGISAVIDPAGNLVETRQWVETGFIKFPIPPLEGETFFVKNGDIISKLALLSLGILFVFHIINLAKQKLAKRG